MIELNIPTIVGGSIVLAATVATSLFGGDVAQPATRSPITKGRSRMRETCPYRSVRRLATDVPYRDHGYGS
jgi:hypothetical protein